ncbi:YndM family protein [Virgibacillus necropolis]|uniref:DUF2512 domain-containing protein n=1 Tax=Virgibacillus necropolis TaxID=163877 RepID=A0A221MEH6_9BACI|nr:YndM family protein [Virgibacillus necropolis]ASN05969.1 hypothetical protein CFK40_13555 [Virgibacillus necropolis]
MKHMKALGIKFIFTAIVVYSIFGIFYNASLGRLFWISVLVTGVAYIIGDLFVLPRFGYIIASIADLGLAFLSLWILGTLIIDITMPIVIASLFAAVFMALCESLFHVYMREQVFHTVPEGEKTPYSSDRLQTEFAEETNEHSVDEKKKENDKHK